MLWLMTDERAEHEALKACSIESEFLAWYGRHPRSEYEFFRSVHNDEIVHRNRSIHEIRLHEDVRCSQYLGFSSVTPTR